jgi:hypothetical protein
MTSFECAICFEQASSPVVTQCGHLFCWQCLHPWLARSDLCPVCKAGVTKENVIPVFTKDADRSAHPASSSSSSSSSTHRRPTASQDAPAPEAEAEPASGAAPPPRPQAHRPAPSGAHQPHFGNPFGHFHGHHGGLQFGLMGGLFPGLVLFQHQWRFGEHAANTPEEQRQMYQSKIAMAFGLLVLLVLFYV